MPGLNPAWIVSAVLVLGIARGVQYDTCNGIPTKFSPKCDFDRKFKLDDPRRQYTRCIEKTCPTAGVFDENTRIKTVQPSPSVAINHFANATCRHGYRFPATFEFFEFPAPATSPRSLLINCTSQSKCDLKNQQKCVPVLCDPNLQRWNAILNQTDASATSCSESTDDGKTYQTVSSAASCDPAGFYHQMNKNPGGFTFGRHRVRMQCNHNKALQVDCNSTEFFVQCEDSGDLGIYLSEHASVDITGAKCVPRAECAASRRSTSSSDSLTRSLGQEPVETAKTSGSQHGLGAAPRARNHVEPMLGHSKELVEPRSRLPAPENGHRNNHLRAICAKPAAQSVSDPLWKAQVVALFSLQERKVWSDQQTSFQSGDIVQIVCISGSAFFSANSFTLMKNLTCNAGTWQSSLNASCTSTCDVQNSDHPKEIPVTAGTNVSATCNPGYRMQARVGPGFAQCALPQQLQAVCEESSPEGTARLNFECKKITCGDFKAYSSENPTSLVTITPASNSLFTDYDDPSGAAAERTRIDCGSCFRANDANNLGVKYYIRDCRDDCTFSGESWNCTRLRCGTYTPPDHASVSSPTSWHPKDQLYCGSSELIVKCDSGYVRKGSPPGTCETSFKVTCNDDRQIVNADETCVLPFCAPITNSVFNDQTVNSIAYSPDNGLAPASENDVITVTCAEGYRGVNVPEGTCKDPSTFTATCRLGAFNSDGVASCAYETNSFSCTKIVCSLNAAPNIVYDASSMSPFKYYQKTHQATCDAGARFGSQEVSAPKSGVMTCGSDCILKPECKPVKCSSYSPPTNSTLCLDDGCTSHRTEATFLEYGSYKVQCDDGFIAESSTAPTCTSFFTVSCNDDGSISSTTSGCMPRVCDCPGAGECIPKKVSCGVYNTPQNSIVHANDANSSAMIASGKNFVFGQNVELSCATGWRVKEKFAGRRLVDSGNTCAKRFTDECLSAGLFRSSLDDPCERITCPTPGATGYFKTPDVDKINYGASIDQWCDTGYEPSDATGSWLVGDGSGSVKQLPTSQKPHESTCTDTCAMDSPLTCTYSECSRYAGFDYSKGVEPVEEKTTFGNDLQIVCKPNYMLDDTPFCGTKSALRLQPPDCIEVKGTDAAPDYLKVLASTNFAPPADVRSPSIYPVTGDWGSVVVTVPAYAWPEGQVTDGVTIAALELADPKPDGLAGTAISFGPHNLQFDLPVSLSLPFDCPGQNSCKEQYPGKTIKPRKFSGGQWVDIPLAGIDWVKGTVQGETNSFSTYAAFSVVEDATGATPAPGPAAAPGPATPAPGAPAAPSAPPAAGAPPAASDVNPGTTTTTATIKLIATTPPPMTVEKSRCMPCAGKPKDAVWVGTGECQFQCRNGTKRVGDECIMCENAATAPRSNVMWLDRCKWSCLRGYKAVKSSKGPPECLACGINLTNHSNWLEDMDEYAASNCKWECSPGYGASDDGQCTPCTGGKDFRAHWSRGCTSRCNPGYTLTGYGCVPCDVPAANFEWSNVTGCASRCKTGYSKIGGKCKKCPDILDPQSHWSRDEGKICTWECNTGYFLIKTTEYWISMPVAVGMGVGVGTLLFLVALRVWCWRLPRSSGSALAVENTKHSDSARTLSVLPVAETEMAPTAAIGRGLRGPPGPPAVTVEQELKTQQLAEDKRMLEKGKARELRKARGKVQRLVAEVADLVSRPPARAGSTSVQVVDSYDQEVAI